MSDLLSSIQYWRFQYQAQSDFGDHRYRTKCPPMPISILANGQRYKVSTCTHVLGAVMSSACGGGGAA